VVQEVPGDQEALGTQAGIQEGLRGLEDTLLLQEVQVDLLS
jgi:hypothetical protein